MYAVKLQVSEKEASSSDAAQPSTSAQPAAASTYATALTGRNEAVEAVDVWAGNPRVEHLVGQVHLYRCTTDGRPGPSLDLPRDRGPTLCVLSLPLDLSVSDFCEFLGAYLEQVQQMRFLQREGARAPSLVVISFKEQSLADQFFQHFNTRPFSSLEPLDVCHVVFVKDLVIAEGPSGAAHLPSPGQVELPSCPVCLEKLDESAGIVTTVCNHQFHNLCLQRWGDTSCPVCRYVANSEASTSHCEECNSSQDVWICLICGRVGCGRYQQGHAVDHWRDSGHCYSLELQSQRVWDYAGDGYVHRLVQSKTGGKLVEVPSPQTGPQGSQCGLRSESSESQAALENALMTSKMDALALEFNHLLVSQLDSQRHYYEGLLAQRQEASFKESAAAKALEASTSAGAVSHREALLRAEQSRKAIEQKAAAAAAQAKAVARERDDLRALNEQVMRNQAALRQHNTALQEEKGRAAAQVQDLQEQVRDLMMFIDAQQHVASNSELQGGGVSAPKPPERRRGSRNRH